ncbi:synaptotagmin-2 isoform X4 [Epinephelus moara]|uniref:synaptotagmin-2 isoform X4 n=1 Tax=Epinephelus moara TaxID=300413 RepID=UPI00214F39A1|nr:synaptotagmin-2 isoform X4 [Epinephelus moara]
MVMLIDYPASAGLLSAAGELSMLLSDTVKYCILGISVTLLLLALGILAWQTFRCCTQKHTTYTWEDTLNNDLLYTDEKSRTAGNYSGAPNTRVDGSLRFSIYYDQLQSQLVVTVLQVEGLLEDSQMHSFQPFVKLRLMWASSSSLEMGDSTDEEGEGTVPVLWTVMREWRTRVVKGSCDPLFGDQFSCILQEDKELHHISLRMEVRDFDKFSRHTVLGEVRVPLRQLNISYPLELQEDLKMPQKDLVGEVLLSLKFLPTSQRLEVGLLKVRTALTEIRSDAALYARISVQCNQCKLRYQKTSAVARCLMTVFNEVLMFSLPEFPLEQCKILVYVYETHTTRKSTKHLIGQLTVGKERSSEDEHWRDLHLLSYRLKYGLLSLLTPQWETDLSVPITMME